MRALVMILAALTLAACGQSATPTAAPAATVSPEIIQGPLAADSPLIGAQVSTLRATFSTQMEEADANADNPGCGEWLFDTMSLLAYDGRVVRVSTTVAGPETASGVHVGSPLADVLAAYPNAQREASEYVPEPGHALFVWTNPEEHLGLHFEIGEDERVTAIHAGGELRAIGGCF
jgi:hypothetical protein